MAIHGTGPARSKNSSFLLDRKPGFFALLSTGYLVVLVVLLLARYFGWLGIDQLPALIGGIVPLAIPWFGSLGGVTSSLYGVFDHNVTGRRKKPPGSTSTATTWDNSFDYWHVLRPAVGAILGTVAYLMFVGFINATEATKSASPVPSTAQATIPYLVIAFVVGFREDTFRQLLKRIIDIILGPGIPGVTPGASLSITPSTVSFDDTVAGSDSAPHLVHVANTGAGTLVIHGANDDPPGVKVEGGDADAFQIQANTVDSAVIPANAEATLAVVFTPKDAKQYDATLTIQSNGGARTIHLSGKGTAPTPSVPQVTKVDPAQGSTGGGDSVTISGSGFKGATAVEFGKNPGTGLNTFDDATIAVTTPVGAAGPVDVTVRTPTGTSPTGPDDTFTYVAPSAPPEDSSKGSTVGKDQGASQGGGS